MADDSIHMLSAAEAEEAAGAKVPPALLSETGRRIAAAAEESAVKAVRFGAFSYLVEGVRTVSPQAGIQLAARFLAKNPMPPGKEIGMNVLEHFAEIIEANQYDWEGLSIAFLDPEAAHQDRIRENLKLSPAERLERHEAFMSQIRRAKRVW